MKNITKKIAAMGAAVMMMTSFAAVSASADDTSDSGFFGQITHWITEQNKEQTKPNKKRLVQMSDLAIERQVLKDYNMTIDQYYVVLSRVSYTFTWPLDMYQLEEQIRQGMENVARYNIAPTWNEDMIRFMKDYWDEVREASREWIEAIRNN